MDERLEDGSPAKEAVSGEAGAVECVKLWNLKRSRRGITLSSKEKAIQTSIQWTMKLLVLELLRYDVTKTFDRLTTLRYATPTGAKRNEVPV